MKTFNRKTLTSWSALALVLVASGCGGEAYRPVNTDSTNGGNTGFTNPTDPVDWGTGYTGGTGGTGGTTPTEPVVIVPAPRHDFSMTGREGTNPVYTSPSVDTDNLLQVRVSAAPAGQISLSSGTYSNFSASYGCVEYRVEALGQVQSTGMLSVYGNSPLCPNAPSYRDLDFSSSLASGHHTVNVRVTEIRYDFYCQMYLGGYMPHLSYTWAMSNYCQSGYPVYKNHTVNGKMQIRVNGTQFSSF